MRVVLEVRKIQHTHTSSTARVLELEFKGRIAFANHAMCERQTFQRYDPVMRLAEASGKSCRASTHIESRMRGQMQNLLHVLIVNRRLLVTGCLHNCYLQIRRACIRDIRDRYTRLVLHCTYRFSQLPWRHVSFLSKSAKTLPKNQQRRRLNHSSFPFFVEISSTFLLLSGQLLPNNSLSLSLSRKRTKFLYGSGNLSRHQYTYRNTMMPTSPYYSNYLSSSLGSGLSSSADLAISPDIKMRITKQECKTSAYYSSKCKNPQH
jgi:hypothetical protein